ncbi:c-type cytochrome [Paracoccus alkanivorans]|uniref:Cytochrome c n=1 Tax=Paracoccus alkanivorans TaxID=2116655 RepID=A0A3M0MIW8_9RHOB|nr:cytochrome c [Paracoccus alkanivorans]RMC37385.1 cytochrome c [Paracoccus alkanivorans]
MRLISLTAIAAITAFPLFAHADDRIEDALEARHGYMTMLAINMGTLAGMAKGEIEYDEAAASTAGANIEALGNYAVSDLFIEGTANGEVDDSDALPAIWENPDDFVQKFADLGEAAAGAGEAVKGGQANVGPVVQKLGGTCKVCHDDYRKKD